MLRGVAGNPGDGVDRMAEQVAVVQARAAAERPHLLPELGLDERVDDDRRPSPRAVDRRLEVVDRLDPWMPDLLEELVGKLGLEREHEPRGCLSGRVGDDVELDRRCFVLRGAAMRG